MRWMDLYLILLETYGPRGWWPRISRAGSDGRDDRGYLPGGGPPGDRPGMFEVAAGAVLTQSTAWLNAERAVLNLSNKGVLSPEGILAIPRETLAEIIRPAGYFNAKARKLIELAGFFRNLTPDGSQYSTPSRESLLSLWGVGPETADSILLFAFGLPSFVVDAYTRRITGRLGFEHTDSSYDDFKSQIEMNIPRKWTVYAEFHAVLVEHAKTLCRKKPICAGCPLGELCEYRMYEKT